MLRCKGTIDQQLKIDFRKSTAPHVKKSGSRFYSLPPPKNTKSVSPPIFFNIEYFSDLPAEKGDRWYCVMFGNMSSILRL